MADIISKVKKICMDFWSFVKEKKILLIVSIIAFLLPFSMFLGGARNSKDDVLRQLEIALKENDSQKLDKLISKDKLQVNSDDLYHLMEYYNQDSLRIDSTISKLKKDNETNDFYLTSEEGYFGEKYKLYIYLYNIQIKSNYEQGKFTIDDETISTNAQFIHLVPGLYKISATLNSDYCNIHNEEQILLMKDEQVTINFDAMNIKVKSQFGDAKILVNDNEIGALVRDDKEIGPVSKDGSVTVSIKKTFPWGEITSSPVKVENSKEINVPINIENEELIRQLSNCTDVFYRSVFKALNNEDKQCIEASSNEAKNKIYQILEDKYIIFKNTYEIEDVNIQKGKNEYSSEPYSATVAVSLKYKVKSFFGIISDEYEKNFFTKLQYVNGEWMVVEVENFNL